MRRSARLMVGAAALAGVMGLAACAGDPTSGTSADPGGSSTQKPENLVVGVSNTLAGNGWRETMICSVKAQALASGQVSKVIVVSKNGGPTEQIQDLQNLISQGVNVIIVNPSDPEKLNDVIKEATDRGIIVVAVDSSVTAESAYVVTNDQTTWGELGAQWIADQIGGKGKVLYMRGIEGVAADTDRDKGFTSVMTKYPDIQYKTVWTGWDYTKGGEIATQEFSATDYDAVWTTGADFTVVNAIEGTGKKLVPVTGQDSNEFLHQLIEGKPGALVTNPAVIGGVGMTVALQVANGEKPDKLTMLTPQVWDLEKNKAELEKYYKPDLDGTTSVAIDVPPYTTYTPDQLWACKGPGE
ncbi:MAG: substrate-binding domain-containing protein [Propionicimonas sp.]|nr:substrate-binding domain-containing protein [Propionicimonas sp.]